MSGDERLRAELSAPEPERVRRPAATTIHDVAREAGVAASTVSRAFTNPQRVNARTREHVLAVADRLGYRPNPLARALPSGRTNTVALLIPDITNPFFFDLIRGAERQARAAEFTTILADTEEDPELEAQDIERLSKVVDGFVLVSRLPDERIRELSRTWPITLVNRSVDGIPHVVIDVEDGMRQIVEHLASLGHRSIAYLGGPQRSWIDGLRWRTVRTRATELRITTTRLGPYAPAVAGGAAAADAAIRSGATAVVAFNDLLAIGTLRRFAERGVRVPDDISVVGHDDIFGADFCSPPLTTLSAPIEHAGRSAVDLLLGVLNSVNGRPSRQRVLLPAHLRIRGSSGPAPE